MCDKMNAVSTPEEKEIKAKAEKARFNRRLWSLHLMAVLVLGLSFFPMVSFLYWVWKATGLFPVWVKLMAFSCSIALGYFIFGAALIFFCVLFKDLFRFKIAPGLYTLYSKEALDWMAYNSLILIANSAFLDVLRLSPFQTLFYRRMGAKVGNDVHINTVGLADLSLLEIGNGALLGGGVTLICHAFDRGFLRLESTRIGDRVSIGLNSVIMPGCQIGDGASIAPCSFLPKGTQIPPRGVWGGNPVRDLRAERREASSSNTPKDLSI